MVTKNKHEEATATQNGGTEDSMQPMPSPEPPPPQHAFYTNIDFYIKTAIFFIILYCVGTITYNVWKGFFVIENEQKK